MKRKNWFNATEEHLDNLMANSENITVRKVNFDSPNPSSPKKSNLIFNRSEWDREDSDYGGSDVSETKGEITTLRMLFERCRASQIEFYESCLDIGLLNPSNSICKECNKPGTLVQVENNPVQGLQRKCPSCETVWSVKRDSWCENSLLSLKELVLIIYCWCHGYSESLTSHELDADVSTVSSVFMKCSSVCEHYYQNPISNIGGENKQVIADIFTYNNRTVLGCMEKGDKCFFYSILTRDYDENTILTLLIDNLEKGSVVITRNDSQILKALDQDCLMYLKESWDICVKMEPSHSDSLLLQWTRFDGSLPPTDQTDPSYENVDVDSILKLALFKKRMENCRDSFLFFLTVVSQLYNTNQDPQ